MKLVFLAGPFRGDGSEAAKRENITLARKFVKALVAEQIPYYSPHLNISEETIGYSSEWDFYAERLNEQILESCSVLAVLPGWEASSGTKNEIEKATRQGIPIVYMADKDAIERLKELVQEG